MAENHRQKWKAHHYHLAPGISMKPMWSGISRCEVYFWTVNAMLLYASPEMTWTDSSPSLTLKTQYFYLLLRQLSSNKAFFLSIWQHWVCSIALFPCSSPFVLALADLSYAKELKDISKQWTSHKLGLVKCRLHIWSCNNRAVSSLYFSLNLWKDMPFWTIFSR